MNNLIIKIIATLLFVVVGLSPLAATPGEGEDVAKGDSFVLKEFMWSVDHDMRVTKEYSSVEKPADGRKKVGVVLSGGGAKGFAHVGALKVLEQAGIPIDYIAGASMGAIIGSLYAIGYDIHTIDSMSRSQNWEGLLRDRVSRRDIAFGTKGDKERFVISIPLEKRPSGVIKGDNILNLFSSLMVDYHDCEDFSTDFKIPFACVAYNLVDGKSTVLDRGSLPLAVRASMSIPGVFDPVVIDDMVLVDGGLTNNIPADVLKSMGAEIIIGIDVGAKARAAGELMDVTNVLGQITHFLAIEAFDKNLRLIDLYIHPNIKGYSSSSFSDAAVDTLIRRGDEATMKCWEDLIALKKEIGIDNDYRVEYTPPNRSFLENVSIRELRFEGINRQKEDNLRAVCRIENNSTIKVSELMNIVSRLKGMGSLSKVNYRLDDVGGGQNDLIISVEEKRMKALRLGARFDSEEKAALLLDLVWAARKMSNSHFEVKARLSENPYGKVEYMLGSGGSSRDFKVSYMFKNNNYSLNHKGKKSAGLDFNQHTADVSFSQTIRQSLNLSFGLRYDYTQFESILLGNSYDAPLALEHQGVVKYYIDFSLDTFDKIYFPSKGMRVWVRGSLYTTDLFTYQHKTPIGAVAADFTISIPITKRLNIIPSFFGRVVIGRGVGSLLIDNFIGGSESGRYVSQQISFVGIPFFERIEESVIGLKLDLNLDLGNRHYLFAKSAFALQHNTLFEIFNGSSIFGVGGGYCYNSIIGPMSLQVDYSAHSNKIGAYLNLGYYF